MSANPPDGYFLRDLLFYGSSLSPSTIVARGASWHLPNLSAADPGTHEAYYEGLRVFMRSLGEDQAVQFQWRVDSDYHDELEIYRAKTEELCGEGFAWCRATRTMRYERAKAMMAAGLLRRERLDVYAARRCSTVPAGGLKTDEQVLTFLDQQAKQLGEQLAGAAAHLPGSRINVMGDREHYAAYRRFLNPSSHYYGESQFHGFEPNSTILTQCCTCDSITTREDGSVVFKYDGMYHQMLVIKRWPQATHWGLIWGLTGALGGNFVITLNCYPQKVDQIVQKEEKDIARLRADMEREKKPSLKTVIDNKTARAQALTGGFIQPFNALMTVRVFAPTLEELTSQVIAVKNAIGAMEGAQYWQVNQEAQARNLFFESFPGNLGGHYRAWDLYAETSFLPDLVPMSSSYTGHLEEGEAIYDGVQGNLVGIRDFANNTPQHSVLIGMTRVGKSSNVIDRISQTDCFYAFTGIIEEGLSYGTLTRLLGSEPIILHPDADITLNYFDTQQMPLSQVQIAGAAAQLLVMAGLSPDPELNARRKAMLAQYVDQLYTDAYVDWQEQNPERNLRLARMAMAMAKRKQGGGVSAGSFGLLDRYLDLKAFGEETPDEFEALLAEPTEDEVLRFAKNPSTEVDVRNLAFYAFTPEMFPTHSALVEMLSYGRMKHHEKKETDHLASMLGSWVRTGPYGKLFDGPTNRRLDGRVAHFELGFLPRSAKEMKEAAVFAVSNYIRQYVVTLPRRLRKRFIFEEPARYIQVPGAEEMFKEFYAQLGKFGCLVMPVTQQYGQLSKSSLRPVIFGNSKQILLMKQQDRHDLDEIGDTIGLPQAARTMIRRYVMPEHQRGNERYSDMAVFSLDGDGASCGTVRNYAPPEMLYVAESSGETFDKREKALSQYADPVEGVFAEVELAERESRRRREKLLK